jgi:hypothetical protein
VSVFLESSESFVIQRRRSELLAGLRCNASIDDLTFALKSSRLVIEVRPTVSALRCF